MNTAYGEKTGQIDGQSVHIVDGNNSDEKEKHEQYVVSDGSGLSLI